MTLTIKSNTDSREIEKLLKSIANESKFDANKYLGKIELKMDPLSLQKQLRDEWD